MENPTVVNHDAVVAYDRGRFYTVFVHLTETHLSVKSVKYTLNPTTECEKQGINGNEGERKIEQYEERY